LYTVFEDWLDLMLYALERDDEQYLEVVEKYDNEAERGNREIDYFTEAFGQLQQGMAETDADLLGAVYEELAMTSDNFGQYFTPHQVSREMAELSITAEELEPENEPYTVADPASGTGRLLIEAARKIPDDIDAVFYGQDKDLTCAKMTALNLCFFNMECYVVYGDSLKVEQRKMWQTSGSALGGSIRELDVDEYENPFEQALENSGETEEDHDTGDVSNGEDTVVELRDSTLDDFK
jgi:hypothetical protein